MGGGRRRNHYAAADLENDFAERRAHGNFDEPRIRNLPASANTLVPLLVAVPIPKPVAAPLDDGQPRSLSAASAEADADVSTAVPSASRLV
jgi:hypothetical protein